MAANWHDAQALAAANPMLRYTKRKDGSIIQEQFNPWMKKWYGITAPSPMDTLLSKQEPSLQRRIVQEQAPSNPGIRKVAVSTYGTTVPVSIGRRVVTANIIDAEPITPRLIGGGEYVVRERLPFYSGSD